MRIYLAVMIGLFLWVESPARAYPPLENCCALLGMSSHLVFPPQPKPDLLQESIWANSEFPQAVLGVVLHFISLYFTRPLTVAELRMPATSGEIEALGQAMNGFHIGCNVAHRTANHPDAVVESIVTTARLKGLLEGARKSGLAFGKEAARAFGVPIPFPDREPSDRYFEGVFLHPIYRDVAKRLNQLGVSIQSALRSPEVAERARQYRKFLQESPYKYERERRSAAFIPVANQIFATIRQQMLLAYPWMGHEMDQFEKYLVVLY